MAPEKTISMAIRVPAGLWRRIEAEADATNSTMTRIVLQAVQEKLGDQCPKCGQSVPAVDEPERPKSRRVVAF